MATTEELLDTFKNMTVLELNEFLKAFEEEFGVTAAAPVIPAPDARDSSSMRGWSAAPTPVVAPMKLSTRSPRFDAS